MKNGFSINTVGFVGLGRMGRNMVCRLLEDGCSVVVYNRTKQTTEEFADEIESQNFQGTLITVSAIHDMISELFKPRVILLMVKAGEAVDSVLADMLSNGLEPDDIVIDAGNSFYEDTVRRYIFLKEQGIHYIDCGTSGGLEGARHGACLMLGGEESLVESLDDLWNSLSGRHSRQSTVTGGSWTYVGSSGAGHFAKMVHNSVEYGMNQAIGEGFALLEKSPYNVDLAKVAESWMKGSVVRGWLIELLHRAFLKDPRLEHYTGIVGGGQTGEWAMETAKKFGVPCAILEQAIEARKRSKDYPDLSTKVVSALRYEYGGHKEEQS
ncbi:MAG: decarboxylating 6-phosphogluconate dehydrogenase [Patescibacteria group bacterium]|nr:decarboxylating 6-phosphogluconate dehydrogenase [Patescibacteria group bacterium]